MVSPVDEAHLPVNTVRMWVIGVIFTIVGLSWLSSVVVVVLVMVVVRC